MTGSTFLNQIGLGGFDLGYLLIGMTVTILLLLIFLLLPPQLPDRSHTVRV